MTKVLDRGQLDPAVRGQDIVYANLAGDFDAQAARIVESVTAAGVQRLIFISSLGRGTEVSRESVATLVADIATSPACGRARIWA